MIFKQKKNTPYKNTPSRRNEYFLYEDDQEYGNQRIDQNIHNNTINNAGNYINGYHKEEDIYEENYSQNNARNRFKNDFRQSKIQKPDHLIDEEKYYAQNNKRDPRRDSRDNEEYEKYINNLNQKNSIPNHNANDYAYSSSNAAYNDFQQPEDLYDNYYGNQGRSQRFYDNHFVETGGDRFYNGPPTNRAMRYPNFYENDYENDVDKKSAIKFFLSGFLIIAVGTTGWFAYNHVLDKPMGSITVKADKAPYRIEIPQTNFVPHQEKSVYGNQPNASNENILPGPEAPMIIPQQRSNINYTSQNNTNQKNNRDELVRTYQSQQPSTQSFNQSSHQPFPQVYQRTYQQQVSQQTPQQTPSVQQIINSPQKHQQSSINQYQNSSFSSIEQVDDNLDVSLEIGTFNNKKEAEGLIAQLKQKCKDDSIDFFVDVDPKTNRYRISAWGFKTEVEAHNLGRISRRQYRVAID